MHESYVPWSVTMKAIEDCRPAIADNQASKDMGIDLTTRSASRD
jgi:hypothetical protein